ncbi:Wadjet anti-phage system protein JetD domain-containing protein [Solilutibacter silvestris]|uniref:Wadjet protein JetD C-terminal domain-containing protein n=1 Tax=Solilutibacter silvestris TaxID=1645665 RepID=A0A2K1Q1W3_9GAMM|nr:Wadjet anti-phage system protein JetD domain-containing protein [Lysobacter silvestris]PNS09025.1 hypothetical protein Lysil_0654 [Lysobacter silvestris]
MPLADEVLADLLQRGERALLRHSARVNPVNFSDKNSPYWQQDYEQRQQCHARLAAAERAGAVQLGWAKQGGADRPLEQVRLLDANKLASFLGITTRSEAAQQARDILDAWLARDHRVTELLGAWVALKSPRGLGMESASDFADALRVLDALKQIDGADQIVRVFSRGLFRDTKRIETLSRHIDLLTAEQLTSPARQQEEVFSALGLVKEPQPFLVAGTGSLMLSGSQDCRIAQPFIGVSNQHITGYSGAPSWVLSIENLTTFHQASQHPDAESGLILYTGGMPSPSWCRACAHILETIPKQVPVYHWGDIDQGGFRIAAHLRNACIQRHSFHPWLMDAQRLPQALLSETTEAARSNMARNAWDAGWEELSQRMLARTIEQEGIPVSLPVAGISPR